MRNKIARFTILIVAVAAWLGATTGKAPAIPLYAQRYHLQCESCHTVLPELNGFGKYFRSHGYRLPTPRHGTTLVAVRYQMEYERDPVNARRYTPGGVLLSNADIGHVSAFIHYNLGAQGGPSGLYLGYLANYNEHTQTLYRGGLFELPLAQSPGQRLDDLQGYGYYNIHVGLNDLPLSSPRWGTQIERTTGATTFDAIADLGEFKGAAYGGAPEPTGETSSAAAPEVGLFGHGDVLPNLTLGGEVLTGKRRIVLIGRPGFDDAYNREGVLASFTRSKFELQGEQWWGHDANADGFDSIVGSSGGYVRAKYYPTPHSYLAVRYDASANPFIVRDMVYYGAFMITPHVRFIMQEVHPFGDSSHLGAAVTVGFPWPAKL